MSKLGSLYIKMGEPEGEITSCCDLAEWASQEIERLRHGHEWQPIEMCPKDGSDFVIWVHSENHDVGDDGEEIIIDCSHFDVGWWQTGTDPMPYGYVDFGSANTNDVDVATHWMLPKPPVVNS